MTTIELYFHDLRLMYSEPENGISLYQLPFSINGYTVLDVEIKSDIFVTIKIREERSQHSHYVELSSVCNYHTINKNKKLIGIEIYELLQP